MDQICSKCGELTDRLFSNLLHDGAWCAACVTKERGTADERERSRRRVRRPLKRDWS